MGFGRQITNAKLSETAQTLSEMEKMMIRQAVEKNNGNLSAAAEQLGITRQTLYNKLKKTDQ